VTQDAIKNKAYKILSEVDKNNYDSDDDELIKNERKPRVLLD
jgi:hypothetical protein